MGKTRAAYPPEFRRQMVDLVRAGRAPAARRRSWRVSLNRRHSRSGTGWRKVNATWVVAMAV